MPSTRRDFIHASLATTAMLATGGFAHRTVAQSNPRSEQSPGKGSPTKKILILGGTGFIGPAIVEAATARGHTLTLFNRGKTHAELFPDIEKLRGDRDPNIGDGLKALQGRQWDVVIDDFGFVPRIVKASSELLAPNVKQYIFISSISVYKDNDARDADETAALATMDDPTVESMGPQYQNYGALKALCEQAAETAMPGRVTNVRPGFIVGPRDNSDRFTYWPVRVERGGEVLAPGDPGDPFQIIDVRDLAQWLVHITEENVTGVFNATGPNEKLTIGQMLDACKAVSNSDARFTWVSAAFMEKHAEGEGDLPLWVPASGESAGFHTRSIAKAIKAGLKSRSIKDTAKATLAWFKTLPPARQEKLNAGLPPAREAELLAAWHQEVGK